MHIVRANAIAILACNYLFVKVNNTSDNNVSKCSEFGWSCISIAVETYGCWFTEAMHSVMLCKSPTCSQQRKLLKLSCYIFTCQLYGTLSLISM